MINTEQKKRYERHLILDEVGVSGQEKISSSKVLVIGAGGLGSPVALYLAAAGVGTIGIADGDEVDLSNLQRQILYENNDINSKKVLTAKKRLQGINSELNIHTYDKFLDNDSLDNIVSQYNYVVDATDNFNSKFMINDICVKNEIPFCHGGILRFQGQVMTVIPKRSTCYRCVFGDIPENPKKFSKDGVLGSVAGIIGTIQATEILKLITGAGDVLTDKLLTVNALTMDFRKVAIKRDNGCNACGY